MPGVCQQIMTGVSRISTGCLVSKFDSLEEEIKEKGGSIKRSGSAVSPSWGSHRVLYFERLQ